MTSQIDIDCRHYYGDRELGTARPVDINDHQESTGRHRQRAVRQTTETPQRLKRVLVSWTKLEKHEKGIQTSFIIQCRHWGLNPQTMEWQPLSLTTRPRRWLTVCGGQMVNIINVLRRQVCRILPPSGLTARKIKATCTMTSVSEREEYHMLDYWCQLSTYRKQCWEFPDST